MMQSARPNLKAIMRENKGFTLLFGINVLVFVLMLLSGVSPIEPDLRDLIRFGALNAWLVHAGESWRLLSSMFVHAGIVHLVMNMLAFYVAITYVGNYLTTCKVIALYILCGLAAGYASISFGDDLSVSVGASGAIAGFFGLMAAWLLKGVFPEPLASQARSMTLSVIFLTVLIGITGVLGAIDNAAHAGGFAAGLLLGFVWAALKRPRLKG